jgi:cobalt-zinc-cadmium efflux system protein
MEHNHGHEHNSGEINRVFLIGIGLNLAYVLLQVIIGLRISSLSLLSDAGHNFLDVSGLALSMLALKLTRTKATRKFTYGFKKSSILISLLNTVILLISIGAIGYESIFRIQHPEELPGKTIALIALIGIIVNGGSAFLFFKERDKDLNIKSAFLHLFSDTLISLGLVFGGILIFFTNWYWIDPLLSLVICSVIVWSTWNLLKSSLYLSMDGVPDGLDTDQIKSLILNVEGVEDVHHLHIWAISTNENAMTGHLVVSKEASSDKISRIRTDVKHKLKGLNIQHCTLETESGNILCEDENC